MVVSLNSILFVCLFRLQCPAVAPMSNLKSVLDLFERNFVILACGPSIMGLAVTTGCKT